MQRFSPKASSVLEKKSFKGFYHILAWRSMNCDHFSNLSFPQPKEAPYEICEKLAQRLQRRSCLKFWIFFPYKCTRKQNWPYGKKVKCQCTTIIFATLVDLQFPMIYVKIQPQGILGFGEEDFLRFFPYKCIGKQTWPCRKKVKCQYTTFILAILVETSCPQWLMQRFSPKASLVLEKKIFKGFYHIWAWRPSWSINRNHFSNLSFPQPKEAPYEIWAKLAQRLQRRSRLKFWTFFPYKCIRKQNWPYHKKVKCQCTTIILAALVDLQFPMIYVKVQP